MRPEKAHIVADLSEKLNRSLFLLVTDYQRMNVNHFGELRNRLAPMGAEVHVVKNSFLRRAVTASDLPDITEQLTGQTAVVTGDKDIAPVAKVLKTFAAEFNSPPSRSVWSGEMCFRPRTWNRWPTCRPARSCRRSCSAC